MVNRGADDVGTIQVPVGRSASCASGATPRSPPSPPARPPRSATASLGYEWDEDLDNGFRPAGLIDLLVDHDSARAEQLQDYGTNYARRHRDPHA